MIDELKEFSERLRELRKELKAVTSQNVSAAALLDFAQSLGSHWCGNLGPTLKTANGIDPDLIDSYTANFERLIKLSASPNRKTSFLAVVQAVTKDFHSDFILPIQQNKVTFSASSLTLFDEFLAKLETSDEGEYFKEALSCAKAGFLRAATVLGWCTAVDRIHQKIVEIGLDKFNVTAAYIASQKTGRFKRFSKTFSVNSLSELREVFDNDLLWVIEGLSLIDSNQHTRLRSCFDMRNHSAHPGEAPITEYNLASLFSDVDKIVLSNPKFKIEKSISPEEDE